jgi:glucose-6-phosphate isomerase
MNEQLSQRWERFTKYHLHCPEIGLSLDISRMSFDDAFLEQLEPGMKKAQAEMTELEQGAIANRDENRMVGHYWLRNPSLAPQLEITQAIEATLVKVKVFSDAIHSGSIRGSAGTFENLLVIGIGGSALGPQFVAKALGHPGKRKLRLFFIDNTDPDGIDQILADIGQALAKTLCLVISKSGGTKETRNGMLEVKRAYEEGGLQFEQHAVAITGEGSELDKLAEQGRWLERFPMWDWVGGRTSEFSAVGLLAAALQGLDIKGLLEGAKLCDQATRNAETWRNPAALIAAMWFVAGNGKGTKDLVVLPYKDRLELFSKYLQQLIMESLGKEQDRGGSVVNQGLAVYGNKGSTDQHAYVQQLRDGINNFFVTFINVLEDRSSKSIEVDPGVMTGDYLNGFFMGTREALYQNHRQSITITIDRVDARAVGVLIALFERAVGLYASVININAYHQPGVEAGKRAAAGMLALQAKVMELLQSRQGKAMTSVQLAEALGGSTDPEAIFLICEHLAGSKRVGVQRIKADPLWSSSYQVN